MSFNRWMVIESVVCPYYGTPHNKKEPITETRNNLHESELNWVKKKTALKGYRVHDSIHRTFSKWYSYESWEQISDC